MNDERICPACGGKLSPDEPVCPNCGQTNPGHEGGKKHHPLATAGRCAYCDSVLYSDEKVCSHCGAANPNFVVHGLQRNSATGGARAHGESNASTGKCPYCGGTVRSNEKTCPSCGSLNPHYVLDTQRIIRDPKTVEELKEYCAERDMPLLRMRFFIGEDTSEPRAFGIYTDAAGNTVVYKNKGDGSRAVRYSGPDEAYGVKQLFTKLLEECRSRGIDPDHGLPGEGGGAAYKTYTRNYRLTNPNIIPNNPLYRPADYQPGPYADSLDARSAASQRTAQRITAKQSRRRSRRRALLLCAAVFLAVLIVFAVLAPDQCEQGLNNCANHLASDRPSGQYIPWDSGGSGSSSWDWDSGSSSWDWDSGSDSWDSWDSGSDSWDSWDSSDSDWDSDW